MKGNASLDALRERVVQGRIKQYGLTSAVTSGLQMLDRFGVRKEHVAVDVDDDDVNEVSLTFTIDFGDVKVTLRRYSDDANFYYDGRLVEDADDLLVIVNETADWQRRNEKIAWQKRMAK